MLRWRRPSTGHSASGWNGSTSPRYDFRRIVKNRAIAYQQNAGGIRQLMPFEDVHGNGGLLTTVGDLLKWNRNFATAQVGGRDFVAQQVQQERVLGQPACRQRRRPAGHVGARGARPLRQGMKSQGQGLESGAGAGTVATPSRKNDCKKQPY